MRIRLLALTLFTLILMSGCVGPFYESDDGKIVALPVGTPFEIRLKGDPDSNYSWKVNKLDTNVVMMVFKPEYDPFDKEEGQGGIYSFYFQTVGEGKTQIEMVYENEGLSSGAQAIAKKFEMDVESKI